jgi:hypothetical protein
MTLGLRRKPKPQSQEITILDSPRPPKKVKSDATIRRSLRDVAAKGVPRKKRKPEPEGGGEFKRSGPLPAGVPVTDDLVQQLVNKWRGGVK